MQIQQMYSETAAVYIGKIILLVLLKDKQNEPKKEMKHFFLILTMTEECKLLYSTITPHKRKGFDYICLPCIFLKISRYSLQNIQK